MVGGEEAEEKGGEGGGEVVGVESEEGGGEVLRSQVGKAEARLAGAVAGARTLRNYRGGGSRTHGETSRR